MGSRTDGALKFTLISIARAQHRFLARLEPRWWRGRAAPSPPDTRRALPGTLLGHILSLGAEPDTLTAT